MLRDRVIDVAQLCITMSILAVLIVLTIALVFKMTAFLGLEALVDLAILN